MKWIIDIPEETVLKMNNEFIDIHDLKVGMKSIVNGTPFDSVIEDIKAEIQQVISSGNIGMVGEEAYNDGCKKCLEIIDKHISGKENE